ncbi:MAG: ATP-binding protein [Limnobacter sp.]|nr:ATP-binding protein [Limnobacter sp.]
MKFSMARRASLQISLLSMVGVVVIAAFAYQSIWMWQQMRHHDAIEQATLAAEQVLIKNSMANAAEMWQRLDEVLLSIGNVQAKVIGADGQIMYGPPVLWADAKYKETYMISLAGLGGEMPMADLELAMNITEDRNFLTFIGGLFVIASIVWAGIVVVISAILAKLQLKPLREFGRRIAEFNPAQSNEKSMISIDSSKEPDELLPVIEQFNMLMGKVTQYNQQLLSFNNNVAHELNTPLSSLTISHELLLKEKDVDSAHWRDSIHSNLEELQRMNRIIQSMLFLAHTTQGQRGNFTTLPSVRAPLEGVLEYFAYSLEDAQLDAKLTGDASAECDSELLKRAVSNLLSNAIRYANAGSTVNISIQQEHESDLVWIEVRNTGKPIPHDAIHRLFEPFYRVEKSRTESHANHGLGLAIVAAISRLHGGEVRASCEGDQVTIGLSIKASRTHEST